MSTTVPSIDHFIANFTAQFPNPIEQNVLPETRFRDMKDWTSLQALIIISSFDWDYGVIVEAGELRNAVTLLDLFILVTNKINS